MKSPSPSLPLDFVLSPPPEELSPPQHPGPQPPPALRASLMSPGAAGAGLSCRLSGGAWERSGASGVTSEELVGAWSEEAAY